MNLKINSARLYDKRFTIFLRLMLYRQSFSSNFIGDEGMLNAVSLNLAATNTKFLLVVLVLVYHRRNAP